MNACRVAVAAVLLLAAFIGSGGTAAGQQPAPAVVPDMSGGWLRLDSGSGSFDGTAQKHPPAALTAAGQAMVVRGDGRNVIPAGAGSGPANQAGQAYIVNNGACTPEGTGGSAINPNSTAIFLLQSKDEVLMVREGPGGRRFYMDGRPHPDLARFTPSMYGHSTGRYEGNALIVETIGLSEGNVPGRGKAPARNTPHRAVRTCARRQASHDHLHVGRSGALRSPPHLSVRLRAASRGQLCTGDVV